MNRISPRNTARLLSLLSMSGVDRFYQQIDGALGLIVTLHRVSPDKVPPYAPNAHLTVTPDFLDQTISLLKQRGFEFIAIDAVEERILAADVTKRFAVLTFDDGYLDTMVHAAPVMRRQSVPYTVYVVPGFIDGTADLWWEAVADVTAKRDRIDCTINGQSLELPCLTQREKMAAYRLLINHLITDIPETEQCAWVRELCAKHEIDVRQKMRDEMMTWDHLRELASDPLCTLGAHTQNHSNLVRLTAEQAQQSVVQGIERQTEQLGERPQHFAYPYGYQNAAAKREFQLVEHAGFDTAVTTRLGMIYKEHKDHLTALPRISLNGLYQSRSNLGPLTSGLPTRFINRMQKLNID